MKRKKIIYIVAVCCLLISYSFSLVGCFSPSRDTVEPELNAGGDVENLLAGGMQVGEIQASGITLMSETVTETSATVEKTVTITASIQPEGVTNQGLLWEVAWTNASSTWANGKTVSDYVTLSVGEDSKVVTISCLQAFGEQITVTALSADNPNVSANCVLEYAQKITSASLSIGDIAVNLGGNTEINVELCPGTTGPGGVISAVPVTSEVYTITSSCSISVDFDLNTTDFGGQTWPTSHIFFNVGSSCYDAANISYNTGNCLGSSMYFDYEHEIKYWHCGTSYVNGFDFSSLGTSSIIPYIEEISSSTGSYGTSSINTNVIGVITLTITTEYNTFSRSSELRISGYTNSTSVTGVDLDKTQIIF